MTKKCPKCGKENEDVASFCANCGYSFNSDFNKGENSDDLSISIESNGSRSTIRLPSLKVILLIFALILVFGLILAGFIGNDAGVNDNKNITLIKEKISGYAYLSDGKPYYSYYVEGVIKNLPRDIHEYDLRGTFYDDKGKFIYEDPGYLEFIKEYSDKSEPTILASCYDDDLRNLSYVESELKDPNGNVVFNKTINYDMDKMDLSGLKKES